MPDECREIAERTFRISSKGGRTFFYKVDPKFHHNVWYFQIEGPEAQEVADLIEATLSKQDREKENE